MKQHLTGSSYTDMVAWRAAQAAAAESATKAGSTDKALNLDSGGADPATPVVQHGPHQCRHCSETFKSGNALFHHIKVSVHQSRMYSTLSLFPAFSLLMVAYIFSSSPRYHRFHTDFKGTLPCLTGWSRKPSPLRDPVGYKTASDKARARWASEEYATIVNAFRTILMRLP